MGLFTKGIILTGLLIFGFIGSITAMILASDISYTHNAERFVETPFNIYTPDGNSSILVAMDSSLLGEEGAFENYDIAVEMFELWLTPFEELFDIAFHVTGITTYTPEPNDSLDTSMDTVPAALSWNLASSINDINNNGNGFDWLIIYQKDYNDGRNRANAIGGNALIIAHNQPIQPFPWTSRQLILLHEVGHIFTAEHLSDGKIPEEWYGDRSNHSIMSYEDLTYLHNTGWDLSNLPMDEHNYQRINNSKYRFDLVDADSDNLPNYYEYRYDFNPNEADALNDSDNDGLTT